MCGIAGIIGATALDTQALAALGARMGAALAPRGPDGEGTWVDPDAPGTMLTHRRLSIVGLGATGDQPMHTASGHWTLSYNGELYNAPELGRELEATGHRFRGTSDTEVLLAAIERWGVPDALSRLDGMFAFAAWDRKRRELSLVRDRLGEKPLAYGVLDGAFAFASDLRALRHVPGFPRDPAPDSLAAYLRFAYVPAPLTIFPGVHKLPAGTWLTVRGDDPRSVPSPQPYWSLSEEWERGARQPLAPDEAVDQLDHTLRAVVRSRLRSDVPLGAFLSGGIDSSLVATYASAETAGSLATFTIASDDPDHDESGPARAIATRLGASHHELVVTAAEALRHVPRLPAVYDEPYGDSSALPTLLVSELARSHVTVALSGDGGDELFGGYNRHVSLPAMWARARRLPATARRGVAAALRLPPPALWDRAARVVPERRRPRLVGLKVAKLADLLASAGPEAAYARLVSHWPPDHDLVAGGHSPPTLVDQPGRWPRVPGLAARLMAVDAVTYLPDDILVKVDRASMSVGLEARVPLLAPSVVELAARLPDDARIRNGQGKWLLRQLLYRHHPRELIDRPKSGFGVPIATWLRGPLRDWAEDLMTPTNPAWDVLDRPAVRREWDAHQTGRRDGAYQLWTALMYLAWREEWTR